MSVFFYTGLSRLVGDDLLGRAILVQSIAAVITLICIPQCWLFLLSARTNEELIRRYRLGLSVELLSGLTVLGVLSVFECATDYASFDGIVVAYASLAVQASSSCLAWLRVKEEWGRYFAWVVGPNLIRVPLVWAFPQLTEWEVVPVTDWNVKAVFLFFFLFPDMVRLVGIWLPVVVSNYRWPGLGETLLSSRTIAKNWLFDVGSAATETADKIVVGASFGPKILVAYFFARKMGIVATMVCEPFYAERFRRATLLDGGIAVGPRLRRILFQGLGLCVIMFAIMALGVLVARNLAFGGIVIPEAAMANLLLFLAIILTDCLLAGNRWSRYLAQVSKRKALELLCVRLLIFAIFAGNVFMFAGAGALGLGVAFGLMWLMEFLYVYRQTTGRVGANFAGVS